MLCTSGYLGVTVLAESAIDAYSLNEIYIPRGVKINCTLEDVGTDVVFLGTLQQWKEEVGQYVIGILYCTDGAYIGWSWEKYY